MSGQAGPAAAGPAHAVPHPFNLSHLSQALSQPPTAGPMQVVPHARPDLSAQWDRFQNQPAQGPQQWQQQPAPQQSQWADSFVGKGKGREMPQQSYQPAFQEPMHQLPPNPFTSGLQTYQPRLQPMYAQQLQQPAALPAGHAEMEAAFEQALADARAQNQTKEETKEPEQREDTEVEKEAEADPTDFKGELDAVWESLKPEAERLNKLAEWEKEFSQVREGVGTVERGIQEWQELLLERERELSRIMMASRRTSVSEASDQIQEVPADGVRSIYGGDRHCSCSSCELELSSSLPLSRSREVRRGGMKDSADGSLSMARTIRSIFSSAS